MDLPDVVVEEVAEAAAVEDAAEAAVAPVEAAEELGTSIEVVI